MEQGCGAARLGALAEGLGGGKQRREGAAGLVGGFAGFFDGVGCGI